MENICHRHFYIDISENQMYVHPLVESEIDTE